MPVSVDCPSCKGRLLFPDKLWQQRFAQRVQRLKCKKCGDVVTIDGRSAGSGNDADVEEEAEAEATIRMVLPAFLSESWGPAASDIPPLDAPPTPALVQEPALPAAPETPPTETLPLLTLQRQPASPPAQPSLPEQPPPQAPLARRKIPLPEKSAAPARSQLLLPKPPTPLVLLQQPASPARLEGLPPQQPSPPPLPQAAPAQPDPAPEQPSRPPPRRTSPPAQPQTTSARISQLPARRAQSRISPALCVGSARLDAAVAFEEAPPWESSSSQEVPAQSSIESRVTLVTEPSEQPSPGAGPKPDLPQAESKPESAIVQLASPQPIPPITRASLPTFTPARASVGLARSGRRRGRWLALSGLAVVALLSVRACMPANADHPPPPLRDATRDVGAPSLASASVEREAPPPAPVGSAAVPENAEEVAAAPAPPDSPNAADSAGLPTKPGPDARTLPWRRAVKKTSASADAAPAENVVPYDKATLAEALSAVVQKAEQCDLWGRATGTAKLFVTFAPTGRVSDARLVGEPLESAAVARCILHHARAASLPPFQGPEFTISRKITLR